MFSSQDYPVPIVAGSHIDLHNCWKTDCLPRVELPPLDHTTKALKDADQIFMDGEVVAVRYKPSFLEGELDFLIRLPCDHRHAGDATVTIFELSLFYPLHELFPALTVNVETDGESGKLDLAKKWPILPLPNLHRKAHFRCPAAVGY